MNPSTLSSSARARLREPRTRRIVAVGLIGAVGLSAAAIPAFAQNPVSMAKTLTTLAEEGVVIASSVPSTATTAAPATVTTTVPAPTTTSTTAPPAPPAPTPEEQARAALAAATPEQQVAFRLLFMSDAERAAFLQLFAPPPAPPVVVKPTPAPVVVTRPAAPAPAGPTPPPDRGALWDRLAQCESGGNWQINTGNGYQGGVQFYPGTWLSMGGGAYAPGAHLATREQQIDIAERVVAAAGGSFRAWPGCRAKLGLP